MNHLLSVIASWIMPSPLPRYEIVEVIGGGPQDGESFWLDTSLEAGHKLVYDGNRYVLEWRNGKRVWVFLGPAVCVGR